MRAFFLKDGRIREVLMLPRTTDEDAINRARAFFAERADKFDGFEVWEEARHIHFEGKRFAPRDDAIDKL